MILHESNGTRQLGPYDELPSLRGARTVYMDLETTSLSPAHKSLNPWRRKHCKILGIAITVDDMPGAYYVPLMHSLLGSNGDDYIRHMENWQGGLENALLWLGDILRDAVYWVNHNIKFDAHVLHNNGGFDVLSCPIELLDTLTKAKLYNSDMAYHGGYGLANLASKLLHSDISSYYEAMRPYLKQKINRKINQDYGLVPPDLMAPYAGQDVITCRDLDWFLEVNMPERSLDVCNTELLLTKVLVDIERAGMPVDPIQISKEWAITYHKLLRLQEHIAKAVGIESFRPHVNEDCYELLCNRWGLPVLAWTDGQTDEEYANAYMSPGDGDSSKGAAPHNPSFSKHALAAYANHTDLTPDQRDVAVAMLEYRKLNTRLDIFLTPYVELLGETGERVIHGTYNQCVRTGRMSCSDPNLQQLDSYVKSLIVPPEGYGIICTDASQIEYRVCAHYIQDAFLIKQYNEQPDVDFHEWMAELCHVNRKSAKTLNFGSIYGMGKKKLTRNLASNNDVMGEIWGEIDAAIAEGRLPPESRQAAFKQMAEVRAERIYNKYHESLPTLKPTSQEVARRCRQRGYTWDHYGRIRHLPREYAHIAFNTICQATAADIVKERTVALWWAMRDAGVPVQIIGQVHDALPMLAPSELALDVDLWRDIVRVLEQPARPLLVPIRWSIGGSLANWALADKPIKDGGTSKTIADVFTTEPKYF